MIDGIKLKLGETEYIVPPLNLKALRRLMGKLQGLGALQSGTMPSEDQVTIITDVVHAALLRNYPDITPDVVEECLDTSNMHQALLAVLHASGFEKKEPGPGEAPAP